MVRTDIVIKLLIFPNAIGLGTHEKYSTQMSGLKNEKSHIL